MMTLTETQRDLVLLGVVAVILAGWVAVFQRTPGYMDADYYYAGALRLHSGQGFTEPYLWNTLADLGSLPIPSHLYWMPLTSLIAAASMVLFGSQLWAAQLPFVLLTAGIPTLTYFIARSEFAAPRRTALFAAIWALLGGFYLVRWPTIDGFTPYALIGTGFLLTTAHGLRSENPARCWFVAGLLAALGHLTRADGLLLLGVPAVLGLLALIRRRWSVRQLGLGFIALLLGYLLLMGPWLLRNWLIVGTPLAPGGSAALFLTEYNDLFLYPNTVSIENWLALGPAAILMQKLNGLATIFQNLLAVQGLIVLLPFIIWGAWQQRQQPLLSAGLLYQVILVLAMGLLFTFQGERGGYFHSATALHPLFMALAALGFDAAIDWVAARRHHWQPERAKRTFGWLLCAVIGLLSLWLSASTLARWNDPQLVYDSVGDWLAVNHPTATLATGNPPGWYAATGQGGVVIPAGPPSALQAIVRDYAVQIVILDSNHTPELTPLYTGQSVPTWLTEAFRYAMPNAGDVIVFEVSP